MKKVKKNKQKNILGILIFVFFLIVLIYFFALTFTANLIRSSDFTQAYSFNEDVSVNYSVLIDNAGNPESQNISKVDIILPNSFLFVNETNWTDTLNSVFVKEGNNLSWSADDLIPPLSSKTFSFNATASTPGSYNLSVYAFNSTSYEFQNLTITINDTSAPNVISFISPSETNNSAISRNYLTYNISAQDNLAVDTITVYLYNSNFSLNRSNSSKTNPFFGNFTNLSEGIYYLNVSVNDTSSNLNSSSELRKVTIDTTPPAVTLISPNVSQVLNTSTYYFMFNVNSLAEIQSCKLIFNNTIVETEYDIDKTTTNRISDSLTNGANNWSINCTDAAGNEGASVKRAFIVDIPASASTLLSGSSTNSSSSANNTSSNRTIIQINSSQIKSPYQNANLTENMEIKMVLKNESHSIVIEDIINASVSLTIYSSPKKINLSVGEEKKVELTNDNYTDLKIKLNSISNNKANLTIQEIHELIANGTTQATTTSSNEKDLEKNSSTILIFSLVGVGVLLLVIGIIFLIKKIKKTKQEPGKDENPSPTQVSQNMPPNLPPSSLPAQTSIPQQNIPLTNAQNPSPYYTKPNSVQNNQVYYPKPNPVNESKQ